MKKILKPEYQAIVADFEETYHSCTCHVCPPCNYCTHEGNPLCLEETPDAWNVEVEYYKLIHRGEWLFADLTAEECCYTTPIKTKDILAIDHHAKTFLIEYCKAQELLKLFKMYKTELLPDAATGLTVKITEQVKKALNDTKQL